MFSVSVQAVLKTRHKPECRVKNSRSKLKIPLRFPELNELKPANHHNLCQNNDSRFEFLHDTALRGGDSRKPKSNINIAGLSCLEAWKVNFISA